MIDPMMGNCCTDNSSMAVAAPHEPHDRLPSNGFGNLERQTPPIGGVC